MNNLEYKPMNTVVALSVFMLSTSQIQAEEKLGKDQEEENGYKTFLRLSRVLLRKGQGSMDMEVGYQNSKNKTVFGTETSRALSLTMAVRLSPIDNVEVYVNVPFVYSQRTQDDYFEDTSSTDSKMGIGDIHTGVKFLISEEEDGWPEFVGLVDVGIPLGESQYGESLATGIGHHSFSGNLMFSKNVHPATLFGGIGHTHYFARDKDGLEVQPGSNINYGFGFGFALNHRLTLSSQFSGNYQRKAKVNGANVPFSNSEPMTINSGLSYSIDPIITIDPSIVIGLNDDAPDTALGLSFFRRF